MVVLTPAQARDLRYLVALHRLTVGLTKARAPRGDSVRTGRSLLARSLAQAAPRQFANRVRTLIPTFHGVAYVETNFTLFDEAAVEATARAARFLNEVKE